MGTVAFGSYSGLMGADCTCPAYQASGLACRDQLLPLQKHKAKEVIATEITSTTWTKTMGVLKTEAASRWQHSSMNIHHFPWLNLLFWGCNCCYAANIHHIIHSDSILFSLQRSRRPFWNYCLFWKLNHMSWSKQVLLSRVGRMKGWKRGGWKRRTKLGWDED